MLAKTLVMLFLIALAASPFIPEGSGLCHMMWRNNPTTGIVDVKCGGTCPTGTCFMWLDPTGTTLDCVCGAWDTPYNPVGLECNALGDINDQGTTITCWTDNCSNLCEETARTNQWKDVCDCP